MFISMPRCLVVRPQINGEANVAESGKRRGAAQLGTARWTVWRMLSVHRVLPNQIDGGWTSTLEWSAEVLPPASRCEEPNYPEDDGDPEHHPNDTCPDTRFEYPFHNGAPAQGYDEGSTDFDR